MEANILLAQRIARHNMRRADLDPEECQSAANLGLVEAARYYEPDRGASFSTYASVRIQGAIDDARRRRYGRGGRVKPFEQPLTDGLLADDHSERFIDQGIGPEEEAEQSETRQLLDAAMGTLPERSQDIMRRHYFDGASFHSIAEELGLSESRVCQIANKALTILRAAMVA